MGLCDGSLIIEKPNNLITQKTHYGAVLPPSQMVFFCSHEVYSVHMRLSLHISGRGVTSFPVR